MYVSTCTYINRCITHICVRIHLFVHIGMNFLVDEFASVTIGIQMNSEFFCITKVTLKNSSTKKFIYMCTKNISIRVNMNPFV